MFKKIVSLVKRPQLLFLTLGHRGFFNWMNDSLYIKIAFWAKMGYFPDLNNPESYNEKIQWLKLNFRDSKYPKLVDKYDVRNYVESKIGIEYLIPLYGVWSKFEDIDFSNLPEQFILKTTHDSGTYIICKNKKKLDMKKSEKKLNKSLSRNYYWGQREWPYKQVNPKIISEKLLVDKEYNDLRDFKFFCFNGEPKLMFIASDRGKNTKFDFFDLDFNRLNLKQHYPNSDKVIERPKNFQKMIELARKLAKGMPHVRVDFYNINGKIYFGELTFFHFSGWEKFDPQYYDELLGDYLQLPNEKGDYFK